MYNTIKLHNHLQTAIILYSYFEFVYFKLTSFVFASNRAYRIMLNNKSICLCLVPNLVRIPSNVKVLPLGLRLISFTKKIFTFLYLGVIIKNAYYILSNTFLVHKEMIMIFSI